MTEAFKYEVQALSLADKVLLCQELRREIQASYPATECVRIDAAATAYVAKMAEITGLDILSGSRKRPVPICRGMVAYQLRRDGYSITPIARALKCDHATLIYWTRCINFTLEHPAMDVEAVNIWKQFQNAIENETTDN